MKAPTFYRTGDLACERSAAGMFSNWKACECSRATTPPFAAGAHARSFSTPKISAQTVKELRDKTGSPMMDCKRALEEVANLRTLLAA